MLRRRRPLARAAMVGGAAYHAGKRAEERSPQAEDQGRRPAAELEAQEHATPATPAGPAPLTSEAIAQLEQLARLKERGVLTEEEFEVQKRLLLGTA
jgi:hypothetical protein